MRVYVVNSIQHHLSGAHDPRSGTLSPGVPCTLTLFFQLTPTVPCTATQQNRCATLLCCACVELPSCVAARNLTLRTGKVMDAQCAPLQKSDPTAVPLFEAVAGLWFASGYLRKRGDSQEGGNLGVYPLVRLPRRQDPPHTAAPISV